MNPISTDIKALADVQGRIETSLITLAGQIAAVEIITNSITTRIMRIERAQERLEKLLNQLAGIAQ